MAVIVNLSMVEVALFDCGLLVVLIAAAGEKTSGYDVRDTIKHES